MWTVLNTMARLLVPTVLIVLLMSGTVRADASPSLYDRTCQYFSNLAFQDRRAGEGTTFRMQLAQDCVDAVIYAEEGDLQDRARAYEYLDRMEAYRQVIIGMIMDRARTRDRSEDQMTRVIRPAVHPVSRTGSYLIAQQMGLVADHHRWTAWRRQAVLPLFRLDEIVQN